MLTHVPHTSKRQLKVSHSHQRVSLFNVITSKQSIDGTNNLVLSQSQPGHDFKLKSTNRPNMRPGSSSTVVGMINQGI